MYYKLSHKHAEWVKEKRARNKNKNKNKRGKPSSSVGTPTNSEKTTPVGPSKLRLKQVFVSKLICLNGGLAKDDAEKMFNEAYQEPLSKE